MKTPASIETGDASRIAARDDRSIWADMLREEQRSEAVRHATVSNAGGLYHGLLAGVGL